MQDDMRFGAGYRTFPDEQACSACLIAEREGEAAAGATWRPYQHLAGCWTYGVQVRRLPETVQ